MDHQCACGYQCVCVNLCVYGVGWVWGGRGGVLSRVWGSSLSDLPALQEGFLSGVVLTIHTPISIFLLTEEK